jgi:hypothetical protein
MHRRSNTAEGADVTSQERALVQPTHMFTPLINAKTNFQKPYCMAPIPTSPDARPRVVTVPRSTAERSDNYTLAHDDGMFIPQVITAVSNATAPFHDRPDAEHCKIRSLSSLIGKQYANTALFKMATPSIRRFLGFLFSNGILYVASARSVVKGCCTYL